MNTLTDTDLVRLRSLYYDLRAGRRSEYDTTPGIDALTAGWLAYWQWLDRRGRCPLRRVNPRADWTGELVDVTVTRITDGNGLEHVQATLLHCVTTFGLTEDQALANLDAAARDYLSRLERVVLSGHNRTQMRIMRRYLEARAEPRGCPCFPEGDRECECAEDERIAHRHRTEVPM